MVRLHCSIEALEAYREKAKSATHEQQINFSKVKQLLSQYPVCLKVQNSSKTLPSIQIEKSILAIRKLFNIHKVIDSDIFDKLTTGLEENQKKQINHDIVFILHPAEFCKNTYRNYGLFAFGSQIDYEKIELIETQFRCSLHPNNQDTNINDWSFITPYLIKGSALIIKDRYFRKVSDENMKALFESLYSDELNQINYQITLLADLDSNEIGLRNKILKNLPDFISQDKIDIELIQISNNEHDRVILGNYFLLTSGHGFNIFGKQNQIAQDSIITLDGICNLQKNLYSSKTIVEAMVEVFKSNCIENIKPKKSVNRLLA